MSHIVLVILEAKKGMENTLKDALEKVVSPSRAEPSCVEYRVHQSVENPCEFFLYEQWKTPEEHQQQFEKPYIRTFAEEAEDLLAKPYQLIFAKELA